MQDCCKVVLREKYVKFVIVNLLLLSLCAYKLLPLSPPPRAYGLGSPLVLDEVVDCMQEDSTHLRSSITQLLLNGLRHLQETYPCL